MTVMMNDNKDLVIEHNDTTLLIKYPDVTYSYWKSLVPYSNDDELSIILCDIGVSLDCSITFGNQRLLYTTNMMYEHYISLYYYYLLHMEDQELYNFYFDCLINIHKDNIQFELDNPIIEKAPVTKTKSKSRNFGAMKAKKGFVRQITKDMFSNKEVYIYSNAKTGETIQSNDPNLLEELNAPKKKVKQTKVVGVSMDAMTFSFKKKE